MSGSGAFWGDSRPLRETCGWCLPGVLLCGAATYLRLSWLLRENLALAFHVATTLNSFHFNPKPQIVVSIFFSIIPIYPL